MPLHRLPQLAFACIGGVFRAIEGTSAGGRTIALARVFWGKRLIAQGIIAFPRGIDHKRALLLIGVRLSHLHVIALAFGAAMGRIRTTSDDRLCTQGACLHETCRHVCQSTIA
jgi:hypothetical protein